MVQASGNNIQEHLLIILNEASDRLMEMKRPAQEIYVNNHNKFAKYIKSGQLDCDDEPDAHCIELGKALLMSAIRRDRYNEMNSHL